LEGHFARYLATVIAARVFAAASYFAREDRSPPRRFTWQQDHGEGHSRRQRAWLRRLDDHPQSGLARRHAATIAAALTPEQVAELTPLVAAARAC
jgi:hypothetical protein